MRFEVFRIWMLLPSQHFENWTYYRSPGPNCSLAPMRMQAPTVVGDSSRGAPVIIQATSPRYALLLLKGTEFLDCMIKRISFGRVRVPYRIALRCTAMRSFLALLDIALFWLAHNSNVSPSYKQLIKAVRYYIQDTSGNHKTTQRNCQRCSG